MGPNPWAVIISALAIASLSSAAGYKLRDFQAVERRAECAASIADQSLANCPQVIRTAFDAVKGQLATTEIEYRDRAIPVIVQGAGEDRAARQALAASVAALNAVEKTHACAASPAFELRRRQLQLDADAEAAAAAPAADEVPR